MSSGFFDSLGQSAFYFLFDFKNSFLYNEIYQTKRVKQIEEDNQDCPY